LAEKSKTQRMAYTRLRKLVNSSSFWTQTNALLRKNLTFQVQYIIIHHYYHLQFNYSPHGMYGTFFFFVIQKRNKKANIRLILFPVILCVLLYVAQYYADKYFPPTDFICPDSKTTTCKGPGKVCSMAACAVPRPQESPPLLQLPAVLCKKKVSCPFNIIFTADNQSFAQSMMLFVIIIFQISMASSVFNFKLISKILI